MGRTGQLTWAPAHKKTGNFSPVFLNNPSGLLFAHFEVFDLDSLAFLTDNSLDTAFALA